MEDFGNYQQSGIISGLDNETVSAMKATQKNFNDDFINGNSTSGFVGILNGVNAANNLIDSVITPKLVTYVTSYVTNIVMSYMTQSVTEMLSFDGSKIISYASKLMPNYLLSAGDILQNLLKTRESMNDELLNDTQQELFNKVNDEISKQVGNITDTVNKQLEKIGPTISNISYYSQMGPVWMSSKLDLATSKIIEQSMKTIGDGRDRVIKQRDKLIERVADAEAKKLAEKQNDKLQKQTKDQLDELEKKKQDAMNKVKTQLINVKLKLFAIIGA